MRFAQDDERRDGRRMDDPTRGKINQLIVEMASLDDEIDLRLLVEALAQDLIRQGVPVRLKECLEEFERQTAIRGLREGRAKEPLKRHVRVRVLDGLLALALGGLRALPPSELPPAWETMTLPRLEGYNHRTREWVVHLVRMKSALPQDPPASSQVMAAFLCGRGECGTVDVSRIPSHIRDVKMARDWQEQREERMADFATRLWPGAEILDFEEKAKRKASTPSS